MQDPLSPEKLFALSQALRGLWISPPTLEQIEGQYILAVLDHCQGNKAQAAKLLEIDRRTLYRRLEKLGVGGEASSPSAFDILRGRA